MIPVLTAATESMNLNPLVAYLVPLLLIAVVIGIVAFAVRKFFPPPRLKAQKEQRRVQNTWNPYR